MAFQVLLAGQDITLQTDQMSIDIQDILGQSSGAGGSPLPQGRAGVVQFDVSMGPANTAIGAGQQIPVNLSTQSSDTFQRANTSSGLGQSTDTEFWTTQVGTASEQTVNSNQAQVIGSSTVHISTLGAVSYGDYTVTIIGQRSNSADKFGIVGRWTDSNNHYRIQYDGTNLNIASDVAGTVTVIKTAAVSLATGVNITLQAQFKGSTISASVWLSSGSQPLGFQAIVTDSSFSSGKSGLFLFPGTAANAVTLTSYNVGTQFPVLVRQGELIFKNAAGQTIWGGYATKLTDITMMKDNLGASKQPMTTINGVDYEGLLARIMVSEAFSAQTDVQIIKFVINKYAPWISTSLLPSTGTFIFPAKVFRNISVLSVIQTIAGVTGYLVWVDFSKQLHYVSPATANTAPFFLSDKPDFMTSFPHNFQQMIIDDNSAINKVTFYGGKIPSNNFFQDVSPLANGNNKVFSLAYYPRVTTDGLFHATVNGTQQVIGFATGTSTPANTFKSQGGLADALMNPDSQNLTFDVAPPSGATVLVEYRFEFPLTVVVTDQNSYKFFGPPYLEGFISDTSVFDRSTAIQRCKVLLTQQSFGLVSPQIDTWQPGLQSGQLLKVVNAVRGINTTYLIQEVETEPLGAGNFVFHLTLGAWNWNLIDVVVKLAAASAFQDQSPAENTETVDVEQTAANVSASVSWAAPIQRSGPYYARSTPVGDGHDAFPGFATISS